MPPPAEQSLRRGSCSSSREGWKRAGDDIQHGVEHPHNNNRPPHPDMRMASPRPRANLSEIPVMHVTQHHLEEQGKHDHDANDLMRRCE